MNRMYLLLSISLASLLLLAMPGKAAILWQSGWESSASTISDCSGGSTDALLDQGHWEDYGPGNGAVCAATPDIAQLSTSEHNTGNRSLQVHFKDGDGGNGPDFRLVHAMGSNRSDIYFREYIKWDANWQWAGSDHKTAIFGFGNQGSQDVYFNIRGNSGGGPSGRIAIHVIPTDTVLSDTVNGNVVPGQWYLLEGHIVSGANGRVEARLNGTPLTLTTEAGNNANPNNLNTGGGVGYIKLDTTYNVFTFFEANVSGNQSNVYYDDVALCDTTWCGPTGSQPPPTVPVINGAMSATGTVGTSFSYQITATNSPTSFGATGLPAGLSVNTTTGRISGTPTTSGAFTVSLSATNTSGSGTAALSLTINPIAASSPCDINQNGVTDILDVQRVVNHALGGQCITQ